MVVQQGNLSINAEELYRSAHMTSSLQVRVIRYANELSLACILVGRFNVIANLNVILCMFWRFH